MKHNVRQKVIKTKPYKVTMKDILRAYVKKRQ